MCAPCSRCLHPHSPGNEPRVMEVGDSRVASTPGMVRREDMGSRWHIHLGERAQQRAVRVTLSKAYGLGRACPALV